MAEYVIRFARSASKELEALDAGTVSRVFPKIEALAHEARPSGCRKIQGSRTLWRMRVGDYCVIYAVYDDEPRVDIVAVRHRSRAYD